MRRSPARRPYAALLAGLVVAVAGAAPLVGLAVAGAAPPAAPGALGRPDDAAPPAAAARPLGRLVAAAPATVRAAPEPVGWAGDIDAAVEGHRVSVAIGVDGEWLYRHAARTARPPASNEKLLLSMALLDRVALTTRIRTEVYATGTRSGPRLRGTLWIVGHGDPEVDGRTMWALARAVRDAGIRRVTGRVIGVTTGFRRDWWAPGWRDYFPEDYVALPTALTFLGNEDRSGRHIRDPELRAARSLTAWLEQMGVRVDGDPGAAPRPDRFRRLGAVASDALEGVLRRMNRWSRNFYAEVLGKWLGQRVVGGPGSIAKGARAIERFVAAHVGDVTAHDGSGLSYWNRVQPMQLVELLWFASRQAWGDDLREGLPRGGQGTLEDRLHDVRVRAKTGTLDGVSALSGWVWLERADTWGQFSILSQGMSKSQASGIEDRIVRIVANRATP
jgi:D-alanyl-D-alanine carboxypeptidase/D-alanyl-D-alanine-endopeptidase (penicillin-binding protein 4)